MANKRKAFGKNFAAIKDFAATRCDQFSHPTPLVETPSQSHHLVGRHEAHVQTSSDPRSLWTFKLRSFTTPMAPDSLKSLGLRLQRRRRTQVFQQAKHEEPLGLRLPLPEVLYTQRTRCLARPHNSQERTAGGTRPTTPWSCWLSLFCCSRWRCSNKWECVSKRSRATRRVLSSVSSEKNSIPTRWGRALIGKFIDSCWGLTVPSSL